MIDKKDNNFDNPNDILALLQDYNDKDFESSYMDEANNTGKSLVDNMDLDNTDDDLLALLDMIAEQDQTETADNNTYILDKEEQSLEEDITEQNENFNDDILAFNDLWDDDMDLSLDESFHTAPDNKDSDYGDSSSLGDIFSDVLSAVNPEKEADESNFSSSTIMAVDDMVATGEEVNAPKKKGLFSKLFKDKKESAADIEKQDQKEKTSVKKKETKKKAVKKKEAKNKKTPVKETEQAKNQSASDTKKEKKKATSKKEKKSIEKKPAKPKKVKNKTGEKIIKDIGEIDKAEKPFNKKLLVALSVMMVSFGILIVFGTRAYTESLSVSNATTNFERKRYTEAYNELYGMPRNNKNKDIYDKVMTVMYVNKHLNTYNNYYALELYPEALDSLIKGLQRYEQYIDRAIDLGIESDLDYIKSTILKELDSKFNVHEKNAIKLANVDDKKEYSKNVYTIVVNNMK